MLCLTVVWLATGNVSPPPDTARWPGAEKIKFRLDDISANGLRGAPDALVAVAYEFCVPSDKQIRDEVLRIDPGFEVFPAAHGRIGCAPDQVLFIGGTSQPDWRGVLKALSSLSYITEIRECFFE